MARSLQGHDREWALLLVGVVVAALVAGHAEGGLKRKNDAGQVDAAKIPDKCERCGTLVNYANCKLDAEAGTVCKLHVSKLHPTQFSAGPLEVRAEMNTGELYISKGRMEDWLTQYQVPVVIALNKFFLVDKHHHVFGVMESSIPYKAQWVTVFVTANKQDMDDEAFWQHMVHSNSVWLFGSLGQGPIDPDFLPATVQDMLVDPYRDLAYFCRTRGCFSSKGVYFAEFYWADFFRAHIPYPSDPDVIEERRNAPWCSVRPYDLNCMADDFKRSDWIKAVLDTAMLYCSSPEAAHLPGYLPPLLPLDDEGSGLANNGTPTENGESLATEGGGYL